MATETRKQVKLCVGVYYVNDDTAREIEKLIRHVDEKMRKVGHAVC